MPCKRKPKSISFVSSFALIVVALLFSVANATPATPDESSFSLKGDRELNLKQTWDKRKEDVRIGSDYLCASLTDYHILLVAHAPQWTLRIISVPRKMYIDVALKDWMRRGPPTGFLHVTSLPDWPCVHTGEVQFLNLPVSKFSMPYLMKGKAVPLKRGSCGELLSLVQGVPPEAGQIMDPYYRTPKVAGFPLRLHVWDFEKYADKPNPVFIFSGGKSDDSFDLQTTKAWISKRQPLPSVAGFKTTTKISDVWVNQTDVKDFEIFMR